MNCNGYSQKKELSAVPSKTIEEILKENTNKWLEIPGVEGTGIGMCKDQQCIKIFTSAPPDEIRPMIPKIIEGYQVDIEYTGQIRVLDR